MTLPVFEFTVSVTMKLVHATISKNKLPLFQSDHKNASRKPQNKIKVMKQDVHLFSRMFIASQSRSGDVDNFFKHENHAWPPSLAESNHMRQGVKSDLIESLKKVSEPTKELPSVEVVIVDGASAIHKLDPKKHKPNISTFEEYAKKVFLPYICKQAEGRKRVDVVWDTGARRVLK